VTKVTEAIIYFVPIVFEIMALPLFKSQLASYGLY